MTFGDPVTNLPRRRAPSLVLCPLKKVPPTNKHTRQRTSISAKLSEAVAVADVAHKPTLKTVGKSDCEVKIIKARECRVLPDDDAGNCLSPTFSVGTQRRVTTPLLGRPGLETHYFALRGETLDDCDSCSDDEEFSHLPASADQIRRLTSHMWAVRKTAFANGRQNGSRLKKQIDKQTAFLNMINAEASRLAGITTPVVYSSYDDALGNRIAEMAYCPFDDTLELIMKGDANALDWMTRSIVTIIEHNVQRAKLSPFSSVAPDFRKKADSVIHACRQSRLLSAGETTEVEELLKSTLNTAEAELSNTLLPIGACHGDLTLQNMLWDLSQRQMAVFDFLDCFVESPLQDVAKLFQDICHHWFFTQKTVKPSSVARVLNVFCLVESAVTAAFGQERWWPLVSLFDLFCLARVLPYVTEITEKNCLMAAIRKWNVPKLALSARDSSIGSSRATPIQTSPEATPPHSPGFNLLCRDLTPPAIVIRNSTTLPRKSRAQVTLIVTALGSESAEVYPDGNPKAFTIHPSGSPMLVECMRGLDLTHVDRVYIALSHSLVASYCVEPEVVLAWFDELGPETLAKIALALFEQPTCDVVETVSMVIDLVHITGAIFVKDADNSFATVIRPANCVSSLNLISLTTGNDFFNMDRKSYATFMYDNILANVYENSHLSSVICAGGYGFNSARSFLNSSASLRDSVRQQEIALGAKQNAKLKMSDVVFRQLLGGAVFFGLACTEYADWGSIDAWQAYMRSFKTVVFSADRLIHQRFLLKSRGLSKAQDSNKTFDFTTFQDAARAPRSSVVIATKFPASYLDMVRTLMSSEGVLSSLGNESRIQFLHSYATDASMQELGWE